MTFIVGLGGGIGSGKTAASDRFESLGICVVDADLASRAVVEKGRPALAKIAEHFGDAILTQAGALDRAELRSRIFAHPEEKRWLETLLHPLIGAEINQGINSTKSDYALLVSPLLIESGQYKRVDRVLIIDAPEAAQVARAGIRDNNTPEQVQAIMRTQANRTTRTDAADDVIHNNGTLEQLHQAVDKLHEQYLQLAALHNRRHS